MLARATMTLRTVLTFSFLFWSATPSLADENASPCLESLQEMAVPHAEMTLTRSDGATFQGRLQRVDPGDGRLSLEIFDSSASRFSTMEFDQRDILDLTYRRDTTEPGVVLLFVGGAMALGIFAGIELGGGIGDFTNGESNSDLAAGGLGLLGGLAGLIAGLALAPKSSEEVRLDCRPAGP